MLETLLEKGVWVRVTGKENEKGTRERERNEIENKVSRKCIIKRWLNDKFQNLNLLRDMMKVCRE